jgi:demethylmenaquinone methyltransferase/2-methoxy-6-polyprenyl-1,4-benzoquinol methylase
MRQQLLRKESSEIRAMFGRIAGRYDLLNRLLSLGRDVAWRRAVARRVAALRPAVVLDICTGTGDLALALGRPTVGADFCLPMLALARRKAEHRGRALPLCAADALRLPFADTAVDAVTVAFGVRNFEALDAGLRELVRVLRPGGALLVLEFARPRGPLAPALGWWARTVPPRLGRLLSGDREAYSYLPASVSTFPDGTALCRSLEAAGLVEVTARPLTGGVAALYEGRRPLRETP